ncbi:MAG: hypothetical protein NC350_02435 [Corallococcus sp.]|nr:hypothetical protein [Corallococcus sp.]
MTIRTATMSDWDELQKLYAYAREFMKNTGNPTQWKDCKPYPETLADDISKGNLHIIEHEGETVGAFALIIGDDPTYGYIENGKWLSDDVYGTIHRVASNGKAKGIFDEMMRYCESVIKHLRIDTHENNKVMRHLISKHEFCQCGIIYIADNTPRLAYEKV